MRATNVTSDTLTVGIVLIDVVRQYAKCTIVWTEEYELLTHIYTI